jgi:hypothetical protein
MMLGVAGKCSWSTNNYIMGDRGGIFLRHYLFVTWSSYEVIVTEGGLEAKPLPVMKSVLRLS